jgi:hypothetical protein
MAISVVQSNVVDGTTGTDEISAAFLSNTTAGNWLLFFCALNNSTAALAATFPSDSLGNTLVNVTGSPVRSSGHASLWAYLVEGGKGGADTVNFKFTTNPPSPELYIFEISAGVGNTLSLDSATIALTESTSGSATPSAGPVTTGHANELAFSYCYVQNSVTTAGTGWTLDSKSPTAFGAAAETQAVATSGTAITATFNVSAGGFFVQALLSVYATSTSSAPKDPLFFGTNA